jgi:hypothetical protein
MPGLDGARLEEAPVPLDRPEPSALNAALAVRARELRNRPSTLRHGTSSPRRPRSADSSRTTGDAHPRARPPAGRQASAVRLHVRGILSSRFGDRPDQGPRLRAPPLRQAECSGHRGRLGERRRDRRRPRRRARRGWRASIPATVPAEDVAVGARRRGPGTGGPSAATMLARSMGRLRRRSRCASDRGIELEPPLTVGRADRPARRRPRRAEAASQGYCRAPPRRRRGREGIGTAASMRRSAAPWIDLTADVVEGQGEGGVRRCGERARRGRRARFPGRAASIERASRRARPAYWGMV